MIIKVVLREMDPIPLHEKTKLPMFILDEDEGVIVAYLRPDGWTYQRAGA